jgi:hypothetical protein
MRAPTEIPQAATTAPAFESARSMAAWFVSSSFHARSIAILGPSAASDDRSLISGSADVAAGVVDAAGGGGVSGVDVALEAGGFDVTSVTDVSDDTVPPEPRGRPLPAASLVPVGLGVF